MSVLDYFRSSQSSPKTAAVAKERLQIIVAHERRQRDSSTPDYFPLLQREVLEVVRKYVIINDEHIKMRIEKDGHYEVLELNIALPERAENHSRKKK